PGNAGGRTSPAATGRTPPRIPAGRSARTRETPSPVQNTPRIETRAGRQSLRPSSEIPGRRSAVPRLREGRVMLRRNVIVAVALAAALTGCETWVDTTANEPPVMTESLRLLVGHWQGTIWETAAVFYQGQTALDVRITDDGRWSGTIGRAPASGVVRM